MAFKRFSIYPSNFGGVLLRDLTDIDVKSASKKSIVIPGGDVHPRAIVQCCADPVLSTSTKDFDGVFGGLSSAPVVDIKYGYLVDTTLGSPTSAGLIQFQHRADGATFDAAATTSHVVGTSNRGFLHCTGIDAAQDDEEGAKISLEYVLLSTDGMTDPITFSNASALSSTPNFDGIWYLGPVRVGTVGSSTVQLQGVQSISIKPGVDFRAPRGDGNVYPANGSIHAVKPEIRITVMDIGSLNLVYGSLFGRNIASTAFNLYLQKGAPGGSRVATTVANHYLITAATGDDTTDSISVKGLENGMAELIIRPTGGIVLSANQLIATT